MKIAYIITPHAVVDKSNGIKSQAVTWGNALQKKGHHVDYIDIWNNYDWLSYDVIHFFGNGPWVNTIRTYLSKKNPKCVYSPIYDPNPFLESKGQLLQKSLSKFTHGKWNCALYNVCREYQGYKRILVRTEHEREMIKHLFDVPEKIIEKVPLSYSFNLNYEQNLPEKEDCVFHCCGFQIRGFFVFSCSVSDFDQLTWNSFSY